MEPVFNDISSNQDNRNGDQVSVTMDDWFAGGQRVYFDPNRKRMSSQKADNTLAVFERTENEYNRNARWVTFLPGFPDGSYGYAKIDKLLDIGNAPRLYIEYVGQGDSDKPALNYSYGTKERADLVEAQWQAHGVYKTVLVTYDYSSLVMMELLQRQRERSMKGIHNSTRIEHVLAINGGYFADGHSHPLGTTPLLNSRLGKMSGRLAQRSNLVMNGVMLKPLYSREYRLGPNRKMARKEMRETAEAIRLHRGATFLSQAAGFVAEHKTHAKRWDLKEIYTNYCIQQGITFHLVGSKGDRFEHRQIKLAGDRLGEFYPSVKIEKIPGGHLSLMEQPAKIASLIQAVVRSVSRQNNFDFTHTASRPWTTLDAPSFKPGLPQEKAVSHTVTTRLPAWSSLRR